MNNEEDFTNGLFTVICNECSKSFLAENGQCECGNSAGKLNLNVSLMLNRVYDFYSSNQEHDVSRPTAIALVYDVYWHLYNHFDIMNDILNEIDVSKLDETVLICFMIATFKYIKEVPNHIPFCHKVIKHMKDLGNSDEEISNMVTPYLSTGNYWEDMNAYGAPEWLSGPKPHN